MSETAHRLRGVPLIDVWRGDLVESIHDVAMCVADARGRSLAELGEVDAPVYLRSSAKPFIAAAVVAAGAVERFGLTAREIAIMSASHHGEPEHLEAVRSILHKIGSDVAELRCDKPARALRHNCSGKHAGILALCRLLGTGSAGYLEPGHLAQQRILEFCARITGDVASDLPLGVDGCGIPVFATSLRHAARAYARFATFEEIADADGEALGRVRAALLAEPFYLGGSTHFDTALIEATNGRVVGKAGAEAVHADALIEQRCGLVLKVIDGSKRARDPATVALLKEMRALDPAAEQRLAPFAQAGVRNAAGRVVGRIRARSVGLTAPHRQTEIA